MIRCQYAAHPVPVNRTATGYVQAAIREVSWNPVAGMNMCAWCLIAWSGRQLDGNG
jgi:hypothetical protein